MWRDRHRHDVSALRAPCIPIFAVTRANGKSTTCRMIAEILTHLGLTVGLTSTNGVYIGDQRAAALDASGPKSARKSAWLVLRDPTVEAAVLETARGGVATGVLVVFGLVGERLLGLLHVTTAAFQLAGGLLLLLIAVELVFGKPSGASSLTPAEKREAVHSPDIAVFPLAIPLLAGPGAMTAMVLIVQHAQGGADLAFAFLILGAVMPARWRRCSPRPG